MPDPKAVNSMFGRIAHRYDLANKVLSCGIDIYWRSRLVAAVGRSRPRNVLDLATGSGDVAFAMARGLHPSIRVFGLDFCEPMLELIPVAAGIGCVVEGLYPNGAATLAATLGGIAALSLVVGSGGNFRAHFWYRYGETKAFDMVRRAPEACGVVLHLEKWTDTPGYTGLHRNLPIYYAYQDADFERLREAANYVLSRTPIEGYTKIHLWTQDELPLYLYRRGGGCAGGFLGERLIRGYRPRTSR